MQSNNYTHITANGTYVITPNQCFLEAVFINQVGTAGNLITVKEGNGNVIAVRDGTQLGGKFDPDLSSIHGCIIVISGGTAGDYTVVWQ